MHNVSPILPAFLTKTRNHVFPAAARPPHPDLPGNLPIFVCPKVHSFPYFISHSSINSLGEVEKLTYPSSVTAPISSIRTPPKPGI